MADQPGEDRKSQAATPVLVTDPQELAKNAKPKTAFRQATEVLSMIEHFRDTGRPFRLRPSMILTLQRVALEGITSYAGLNRPADIAIGGSRHQPPPAYRVPELVEDLCDYVNENWDAATAIHLCAYVMWRLNWIHPFADGNGRTSRAAAYSGAVRAPRLSASRRKHDPRTDRGQQTAILRRSRSSRRGFTDFGNCRRGRA